MPPVDRHNPIRAESSESDFSLMEFMREFPDDQFCLEHLWRARYSDDGEHADCPKCGRLQVPFRRYATAQGRQSWTCTQCGHHVHPTAGTIFQGSSTSLQLWYYAMYLVTSTRCGISAKQLERQVGVSYKTAWRMLNKIRNQLMAQDDELLSGEVEADETYIGGKPRASDTRRARERAQAEGRPWKTSGHARKATTTVFGAVERGGRVRATVVSDSSSRTLGQAVERYVLPESVLFTDEWQSYLEVGKTFLAHHRIRHSEAIYVSGNVHTQTIEGFFSNMKRGIAGTYHAVSTKWLQGYLNEFAWRYSERDNTTRSMFDSLLARASE
jgi:transposase